MCGARTRENGFNLKQSRFRLVFRNDFFTVRLGRNYNIFFREDLDVLHLGVLKVRLDGALNNLI